jgi:tRNA threonylcarbamoyladenosine biosynthesis protein TsaB
MTIVGFDTSMPVTAACVLRPDGRSFATPPPSPERLLGRPEHSAELLPALAELLQEAGVDWPQVRGLAVGVGPGTFTGLRIGVATARALAHALGVGIRPVSSLAALAAGLAGSPAADEHPLLPLIDARRRQVFASLYRPGSLSLPEWGPLALGREELLRRLQELDHPPLAAGDWTLESRPDLEAAGVMVPPADSGLHSVNALHVCRLAEAIEPLPPEGVTPTYVRLPDAEINRNA